MKAIDEFANRFGARLVLDERLIVEKQGRYFLLNENLEKLLIDAFFYAGVYLGKIKRKVFFPSFNLLRMIAKGEANKVTVDERTEWLFICGRDIFKQGIVKTTGSRERGAYVLIMNKRGECLGFGKLLRSTDSKAGKQNVVVKNVSDIGDFLRREK
jgi:ribosome biogenesis protein Nip4